MKSLILPRLRSWWWNLLSLSQAACVPLSGTIKCLQVFKCLSPTDFRGKQGPHSLEDLSLWPSGLYLVQQGKLWYNTLQPICWKGHKLPFTELAQESSTYWTMQKTPDFETVLLVTANSPLSNYTWLKVIGCEKEFQLHQKHYTKMRAIMSLTGLHIKAEIPSPSFYIIPRWQAAQIWESDFSHTL